MEDKNFLGVIKLIRRGDIIEFTIDESLFAGKAFGYFDGRKVTVRNGIPGQKVRALVRRVRKKEIEGQIQEVVSKSPFEDRETCKHFGQCGGCTLQSLNYEKQLELKAKQVKRLFDNAGIQDYNCLGIEASPDILGYRNKMEFSFGDEEKGGPLTLGMHKLNRKYDIVTVDGCLIVDEDYRKLLLTVLEHFREKQIGQYNSRSRKGYLRHLVIRKAKFTGEILINLVTTTQGEINHQDLLDKLMALELKGQIVGFLHTLNDSLADIVQSDKTNIIYGRDYIYEKILGLKFKISTFSFFQTNSSGAEKLYEIVKDFTGNAEEQIIFDLYCGTGVIGQIVAGGAKKVVGIELIEEAVEAARENAQMNNINNCIFICGDVKEEIKGLGEQADIIIIDPPRAGINPKAIRDIITAKAEKIVYVSCNPQSLVRDLLVFEENGYKVQKVKCMDMFPHTSHVECVVKIQRVEQSK